MPLRVLLLLAQSVYLFYTPNTVCPAVHFAADLDAVDFSGTRVGVGMFHRSLLVPAFEASSQQHNRMSSDSTQPTSRRLNCRGGKLQGQIAHVLENTQEHEAGHNV